MTDKRQTCSKRARPVRLLRVLRTYRQLTAAPHGVAGYFCLCVRASYVAQALAFSIQRAGFLYGTVDDAGAVAAHFIYEPPQQARARMAHDGASCADAAAHRLVRAPQGSAEGVEIQEDEAERARVDFIAERLGCGRAHGGVAALLAELG